MLNLCSVLILLSNVKLSKCVRIYFTYGLDMSNNRNKLNGNLRMAIVIAYMGFIWDLDTLIGLLLWKLWGHGRVLIRATMGGMLTLTLMIPLNFQATSRSGSSLGISSSICILSKCYFCDPNRTDNITSWEFG